MLGFRLTVPPVCHPSFRKEVFSPFFFFFCNHLVSLTPACQMTSAGMAKTSAVTARSLTHRSRGGIRETFALLQSNVSRVSWLSLALLLARLKSETARQMSICRRDVLFGPVSSELEFRARCQIP